LEKFTLDIAKRLPSFAWQAMQEVLKTVLRSSGIGLVGCCGTTKEVTIKTIAITDRNR